MRTGSFLYPKAYNTLYHQREKAADPVVACRYQDTSLNGCYGSHVWACDDEQAQKFIAMRGLNESISGETPPFRIGLPSETVRKHKIHHALHAVVWLAYLARKTLGLDDEQTLGDKGFVHEMVHAVVNAETMYGTAGPEVLARKQEIQNRYRARIADQMFVIEQRIPGLTPGYAHRDRLYGSIGSTGSTGSTG